MSSELLTPSARHVLRQALLNSVLLTHLDTSSFSDTPEFDRFLASISASEILQDLNGLASAW